jgi:CHAT domain-containing protein
MLRASTSEAAKRWYPSPCTVADVQCRLGKGTMLALYEVTGDHVYVWAVRHDRLTFTRLDADPARLKLAAEEVVAACRAEGPEPDEALRWLGEWLLRPVLGDGGPAVDDLALCVNDILAYLPFEALPLDGTPLVDRCVTRLVPSATTLVQFGIRPRTREPVADFAGFAVRRTAGMLDLPAALREIERVAELFPPPAVVLADEQATVAAVRAHASAHRYVHFATHGVIHDGRPLYSGLPLAPTADGYEFLPAYEMFSLDLCADVVVCSACDTAIGDSRTGEGVVGLSYALFAGGARSVVLSRWPVHDAVGPWFMRAFYSALTGGAAVAAALRHAALASRERYRTPHAWAAFLLLDTALPGTDGEPAGPDDRQ